jgi:hypothetical protein
LTFSLESYTKLRFLSICPKNKKTLSEMIEFLGHNNLWKQVTVDDDAGESDPRLMLIHKKLWLDKFAKFLFILDFSSLAIYIFMSF